MADLHVADCPSCKDSARRLYAVPKVTVDFKPGFDMGLGEYVDTKRQRDTRADELGLVRRKS